MLYLFRAPDGNEIGLEYEPGCAPKIGEVIDRDGNPYMRVVSMAPGASIVREFAHVSHQLPRYDPRAPAWNHQGKPVFRNKREVADYSARCHGGFVYD